MGIFDWLRRGGPTTPPAPRTPIPVMAVGDRPSVLITSQQLQDCMLNDVANLQQWTDAINAAFEFYGLTTARRMAAALAQFGHESGDLSHWEESGFYRSAQVIADTFSRVWHHNASSVPVNMVSRRRGTWGPDDKGEDNSRNLFNRVYSNQYSPDLGNGDEASGDGFTYRGHGLIQVTGKYAFREFGKTQNPVMAPFEAVQYAKSIRGAAMVSAWFFMPFKRCYICADVNDFEGVVLLTAGMRKLPGPDKDHDGKGDGDIIAYPDRLKRWEQCCLVLGAV